MVEDFERGARPLGPEAIAMIRGLIKEYRAVRGCDGRRRETEDAARRLVAWFQSGVTEGEELLKLLMQAMR